MIGKLVPRLVEIDLFRIGITDVNTSLILELTLAFSAGRFVVPSETSPTHGHGIV